MNTTKKGLALASRLIRYNATLPPANIASIQDTCSRICRHAATLERLAVAACNRPLSLAEEETDKAAEARVRELVTCLQAAGIENVVKVDFNGDPRGVVTKLKVTDRSGDWAGGDDYVCVPT